MPYSNKDKQRKFQREYLQRKKKENPKWNAEYKKHQKRKRDNIHSIINHIKRDMGCLLCDELDHKQLQFHHVIPDFKTNTVSSLISNRAHLVTIIKEINKCVCVCTACHSILQNNLLYIKNTILNESWHNDWGLQEALDWSRLHPQNRIKKANFLEIMKAVIRNLQFEDLKKFKSITQKA